jgi:hypothetical protein
MREFLSGKYPRAAAAGAICGLAGIPLMDAVAHVTGRAQGHITSVEFAMIFAAFISIMLVLNLLAGAISQAITPGKPGGRRETFATGFVAGVALLLTEVLVYGSREVLVLLDSSAPGTGGEIVFIHLLFILLLAIHVLPASFINGIIAAAGSAGYNELKRRAEREDL